MLISSSTHWMQEKAYNEDQKYKEGKYILEKNMMLKEGW